MNTWFPAFKPAYHKDDNPPSSGDYSMSKEQKGNKETKKKPVMTAKEKKAAKKAKKKQVGLFET